MTLGEGKTPCVASARIADGLYFKLEQSNPTGSYKDRFIAAEMRRILERPVKLVIATSSGNTGASLAAYAARCGIRAIIFVNAQAPAGKLMQMRAHGATVVRVPRFTEDPVVTADVLDRLRSFARTRDVPLVVSAYRYCPVGMMGVESIAGELAELEPEHVFVPVGGGGLFTAVVRGFAKFDRRPRIHAVQPAGCATVVEAWRTGSERAIEMASTTRISGLSVPNDIDATLALEHLRLSGGMGIAVTDDEAYAAQRRMLAEEGIYAEPAAAAALAGYLQSGVREKSVCLVTGHGFKDPASVEDAAAQFESPEAPAAAIIEFLEGAWRDAGG